MAESDRDHYSTASEEGKSKVTPPHATIEEVVVMSSHERLHELLDRTPASNTLASSSISTPTSEMDITMILVGSNCFPTDIGLMILAILEQLEQSDRAYSEAYDMAKNLSEQVKATKQLLQPKVQFCDSKEREFQDLAKRKFWIEARQAAIVAEIHGAIKETEPIQAQLEKLLLQQDQFKENEGNLKTILDIGDGLWTTLKNIIHPHLPT
ncbi:uncharacterized protein LOC125475135 isoform X3 [Pyrus x bretschneideri]|uniref:uncharacterized protein LOC125475135 isoform X3 n=1 Tax=Pyrus x bretschneideri TaxID=225117 RepID=UPI00202EFEEF|nr:uncharacterized protein LOC125475135 isoform X3 [Pyrus x bretschneideri]